MLCLRERSEDGLKEVASWRSDARRMSSSCIVRFVERPKNPKSTSTKMCAAGQRFCDLIHGKDTLEVKVEANEVVEYQPNNQ